MDLIAYLVELHRDETVNDPDVCGTCFRVISKYLEGKSSKNKKYTTPMADYLFSGTVREKIENDFCSVVFEHKLCTVGMEN